MPRELSPRLIQCRNSWSHGAAGSLLLTSWTWRMNVLYWTTSVATIGLVHSRSMEQHREAPDFCLSSSLADCSLGLNGVESITICPAAGASGAQSQTTDSRSSDQAHSQRLAHCLSSRVRLFNGNQLTARKEASRICISFHLH